MGGSAAFHYTATFKEIFASGNKYTLMIDDDNDCANVMTCSAVVLFLTVLLIFIVVSF